MLIMPLGKASKTSLARMIPKSAITPKSAFWLRIWRMKLSSANDETEKQFMESCLQKLTTGSVGTFSVVATKKRSKFLFKASMMGITCLELPKNIIFNFEFFIVKLKLLAFLELYFFKFNLSLLVFEGFVKLSFLLQNFSGEEDSVQMVCLMLSDYRHKT